MTVDPRHALLAHLDREAILQVYRDAPGDEPGSGKCNNPASSAALAANVFGYFLNDPAACDLSIVGAPTQPLTRTLSSIILTCKSLPRPCDQVIIMACQPIRITTHVQRI